MLFSSIRNWKSEAHIYSDVFKKALTFLETSDFEAMPAGEIELDGRQLFAIIMDKETDAIENRAPEVHEKYIDIQFLVKGSEKIGFARRDSRFVIKSDQLAEKDLLLYEHFTEDESFVVLTPGDFAVFYPQDVHRPLCVHEEKQTVRKVVVKIAV